MDSLLCRRKWEREKERESKEYRYWQEKMGGGEKRRGPLGDRPRKEGRWHRNWQNRGKEEKKTKLQKPEVDFDEEPRPTALKFFLSYFFFIFWPNFSLLLRPLLSHSSVSIQCVHVLFLSHARILPFYGFIFQLSPSFLVWKMCSLGC